MKGKIVHIEIPADDTQRAMKFWGDVTGWKFKNYGEGQEGMPEYNMFEGEPGGGLYPAREGEKGIKVYFEVDDIDAEIEGIRNAGGTIDEKMPVPSMGWFAEGTDTEGNKFSVWQSDESAPVPEGTGAQSASSN